MARSSFSKPFFALPGEEGKGRILLLLLLFLLLFSPLDSESAGGLYPFTVLSAASLVLLAVFVRNAVRSGGEILRLDAVTLSFAAFFLWCGLSLSWTIDRPSSEYGLIRILAAFTVFVAASGSLRDEEDYLFLFRAAVLCGGALSLLGLAQFVLPIGSHGSRAHSLFVTPNSFAGLLLLLLPLSAALAVRSGERRSRLWTGNTLLLAVGFAASGSRGAWLALAAAASLLVLAAALGGRLPPRATISAALGRRRVELFVAAAFAALFVFQAVRTGEVGERFRSLKAPLSAEPDRYRYWKSTLEVAGERPLLGYGLRTFHFLHPGHRSPHLDRRVSIAYSHNDYLQMAAETGIVGFGLFVVLALTVGILSVGAVLRAGGGLAPPAALGLIAVMLHSFVDFDFHIPAIQMNFWLLAAFLASTTRGERRRQPALAARNPRSRRLVLLAATLLIVVAGGTVGRHYFAEGASTKGFSMLAGGDFTGAREHFGLAARLVPYSSFYRASLGRVDAAQGEKRGDRVLLERAEAAFRRALAENPFDHKAQLILAVMLSRNLDILGEERRDDLVAVLREGIAHHPRIGSFSYHLGRVLIEGGRSAEALPVLAEYLSRSPGETAVRLLYAEALLRSGDPGDARHEARRVLEEDPRNGEAAQLMEEIGRAGGSGE